MDKITRSQQRKIRAKRSKQIEAMAPFNYAQFDVSQPLYGSKVERIPNKGNTKGTKQSIEEAALNFALFGIPQPLDGNKVIKIPIKRNAFLNMFIVKEFKDSEINLTERQRQTLLRGIYTDIDRDINHLKKKGENFVRINAESVHGLLGLSNDAEKWQELVKFSRKSCLGRIIKIFHEYGFKILETTVGRFQR